MLRSFLKFKKIKTVQTSLSLLFLIGLILFVKISYSKAQNINSPWLIYGSSLYDSDKPTVYKAYASKPDGSEATEINIGYKSNLNYLLSHDGKYLLRYGPNILEIAESADIEKFKTIFQSKKDSIGDVLWSPDSSKIILAIYHPRDGGFMPYRYKSPPKTLISINRNGKGRKFLKNINNDKYIDLQGLNLAQNKLYWIEKSNYSQPELVSLDVKKRKVATIGNVDVSRKLTFSPDNSKVYYVENEKTIMEHNFSTQKSEVIYSATDDSMKIDPVLTIDPQATLLLFTRNDQADNPGKGIFSIDLSNKTVTKLLYNVVAKTPESEYTSDYYNVFPFTDNSGQAFWSSSGTSLILKGTCSYSNYIFPDSCKQNQDQYYIFDVGQKNISLSIAGNGTRIIGWLFR